MALREAAVWVAGCVWLAAALCGFAVWERYDATPGAAGAAPADLPAARGRWALTVVVHPHCPCGRATLRELAELAAAAPDLAVRVLVVRPGGTPDGWERGEAWELAARVPGAEVECDVNGDEARRLGTETSGAAVLADPSGRVVFRGGLTAARGRVGASAGRSAVLAWVEGGVGAAEAPVFGCPLFDQVE